MALHAIPDRLNSVDTRGLPLPSPTQSGVIVPQQHTFGGLLDAPPDGSAYVI